MIGNPEFGSNKGEYGMRGKPRFPKICSECNSNFLGRQANSKRCDDCKKVLKQRVSCLCGCGKLARVIGSGYYSAGCKSRGKTYKQIYGKGRKVKSGFKKGKLNPNYTRSKFTGCVLSNSRGEKFRSSLEVRFSEFCIKNNIKYENEVRVPLNNGKLKIVDFVIEGYIYVEISGFAYPKWQHAFINKMKVLRESVKNPILVLTYKKHLTSEAEPSIFDMNIDKDMFFENIDNQERILKKINMLLMNDFINNNIIGVEKPLLNFNNLKQFSLCN